MSGSSAVTSFPVTSFPASFPATPSPYRDKRSEFFKKYFEAALPYAEYLKTGTAEEQSRWHAMKQEVRLAPVHHETLKSFKRKMPVLVLSGIWCGDCVRQGPMLAAVEEGTRGLVSFRFLDNRQNPELQDEIRVNGAEKVPVVVVFSEDFYELSRFGDRHLSVYRKKAAEELGAACDPGILPPPENVLEAELGEWVLFFERLQLMLRLAPALRKRYND